MVALQHRQLFLKGVDLRADALLFLGVAIEVGRHLGGVLRRQVAGDRGVLGHDG
ncbi:hypothetical protein [Streptomyces pharetrae]|uniref:hypothetical protein n=1 Tax=Streptomyces pharetrae TaxID=291370 RepID=UPI00296E54CD